MKIKRIIYQYRRDFKAEYECEHCGHTYVDKGYDDDNFHVNVIPSWQCPKCGKKAPDDYRALRTKYPEGVSV